MWGSPKSNCTSNANTLNFYDRVFRFTTHQKHVFICKELQNVRERGTNFKCSLRRMLNEKKKYFGGIVNVTKSEDAINIKSFIGLLRKNKCKETEKFFFFTVNPVPFL